MADTVSATVIAVLLVIAALVVVIGLISAFAGRRRTQLIITDIAESSDLPASVTAGLSALLRQQVRRELAGPDAPDASSLTTVSRDIEGGMVALSGIDATEPARIQAEILAAPAKELLSSQRDELAVAAGGIRAIAPDRADGLLGALAVALPRQRGLLVNSTPLVRQVSADIVQIGLTIDAGQLDRAPTASATFWSDAVSASSDGLGLAQRSQLFELLPHAAKWICLHVIGALGISAAPGSIAIQFVNRGQRARRAHDAILGRRLLRDVLTAQLSAFAMQRLHDQPMIALGFADQGAEDAYRAARGRPEYHRPHYILGTIHDHRGSCYETASRSAAPGSEESARRQRTMALTAFRQAEVAFTQAEQRLAELEQTAAVDAETARIRVRRLKAALAARRGPEALDALAEAVIPRSDTRTQYNAACLYAIAAAVAGEYGRDGQTFRLTAIAYLVLALSAEEPNWADYARNDVDLRRGLSTAVLAAAIAEAVRYQPASGESLADTISRLRPTFAPLLD